MNCTEHEKTSHTDCGKFSKDVPKEEQLKHLKDCKSELLAKVAEIDAAIKKLEEN
ncbi:MAG: hypothetical protein ACTSXO_12125 [Candidatus Heimdallarchaeota archaeon]